MGAWPSMSYILWYSGVLTRSRVDSKIRENRWAPTRLLTGSISGVFPQPTWTNAPFACSSAPIY
jgi:hypothetical protein